MIARGDALKAMAAEEFDLVVVGGGITGAGVALDAASRGYSVALLERADYASGTSSRSSKLVHGGLRYLQNFDLGLVREALLERQLMVALAPHLVRPLPLVVPAFDGARPDRLMGVGLNLYDVMSVADRRAAGGRLRARRARRGRGGERGGVAEDDRDGDSTVAVLEFGESWSPERHRMISGEEVVELLPALVAREPTGGYLFYDCQTDDARLVLTVLGEAERFGAICANRLYATALLERDGRARGVHVRDQESGARFELRATNVVNATGVWADRLLGRGKGEPDGSGDFGKQDGSGDLGEPDGSGASGRPDDVKGADGGGPPRIRPSRGTHLVLRREDLPLVAGAIVPAGAGRSIFALPWLGRTLVGTTDNDYDGSLEHVRPSDDDIGYLLDAINDFFPGELDRGDVAGAFAGVRPLISMTDSKRSVDISRKAELFESPGGVITITGGKLTTWRRMAKLAVDRLVEREAREAPCRTAGIPLGQPIAEDELLALPDLRGGARAALAARYGYGAHDVIALAAERPELTEPILPGMPDLMAEVVIAARREQARSAADVLLRRTRLGLLAARELCDETDGAQAEDAVARVCALLGEELGWDQRRRRQEGEDFRAEAREEGIVVSKSGLS